MTKSAKLLKHKRNIKKSPNTNMEIATKTRSYRMLEMIGNGMSIRDAGIAVGLSPKYAESGNIPKTKSFKEAMAEVFNPDRLANIYKGQLNATTIRNIMFSGKVDDETIERAVTMSGFVLTGLTSFMGKKLATCIAPDYKIREGALDQINKMTKRYSETVKIDMNKYENATDAELSAIIRKQTKFFKKQD